MLTKQVNCMQTHYFFSSITEYRIDSFWYIIIYFDGSFDGPGDWLVISGVGSETGSREGVDVALSPVLVFTSSEAPFLPLSDSAENSFCCPFSKRSHFFGSIRVCLNETVAWNSPPPILFQQQGRTDHLICFDWPMITLLTNIQNSSVALLYLI